MNKFFATLLAACLLQACGTRGPLILPPGPAPEPLLGNPKPAPKTNPQAPVTDLSTAPKAPTQ